MVLGGVQCPPALLNPWPRKLFQEIEALTQKDRWYCEQCRQDRQEYMLACWICGTIRRGFSKAVIDRVVLRGEFPLAFGNPLYGMSFGFLNDWPHKEPVGNFRGDTACYAEVIVPGEKLREGPPVIGRAWFEAGQWGPSERFDKEVCKGLGLITRVLALHVAQQAVEGNLDSISAKARVWAEGHLWNLAWWLSENSEKAIFEDLKWGSEAGGWVCWGACRV
jgi:hypothetical protein